MVAVLTALLPHTVDVVSTAAGADDAYGNASAGTATRTTVRARLWQASSFEATTGRDTAAETWFGVFPAGTVINAGDRVEWDGKSFDVQGAPSKVFGATSEHHVEAELHYAGPVS